MRDAVRRYYFPLASLLLLALTIVGFWDNLVSDTGQPSNSDPKFIIHGVLCGAWIILLVAQTWLVRGGNVRLHRRLGIAGAAIATGVTLSTIWVFVVIWNGWAVMAPDVKINRLLLLSYSLFVILALRLRRRPDWHKRLIFIATLLMLDPVLGRVYDPLVVPLMTQMTEPQIDAAFLPWLILVWLGFFVSLAAYDAIVARRLHPVTLTGLLWFAAAWTIALML